MINRFYIFSSIAICTIAWLVTSTQGQSTTPKLAIHFDHYGLNHGLQSSTIHAITKDEKGLIWVGTATGLQTFDGERFRTPEFVPRQGRSGYSSLLYDPDHGLWAGTVDMLILISHNQLIGSFPIPSPEQGFTFCEDIQKSDDGKLYVSTGGAGLLRFDTHTMSWMDEVQSLKQTLKTQGSIYAKSTIKWGQQELLINDSGIRSIEESPEGNMTFKRLDWDLPSNYVKKAYTIGGNLYLCTDNGIAVIDPHGNVGKPNHKHVAWDNPYHNYTKQLLQVHPQTFLVGTAAGLIITDNELSPLGSNTTYGEFQQVYDLTQHEPDKVWIGHTNGLSLIELKPLNSEDKPLISPDRLVSNSITALAVHENNFWIGTKYGINLLNSESNRLQTFQYYDNTDSLASSFIEDIQINQAGDVFLSTRWGGSFYQPRTGKFTNWKTDHLKRTIPSNRINRAAFLKDSTCLIASANGLEAIHVYEGISDPKIYFKGQNVTDIVCHEENCLAIADNKLFYKEFNSNVWRALHPNNEYYLLEWLPNFGWAAVNQSGIIQFSHNPLATDGWKSKMAPFKDPIVSIYPSDQDNTIWLGTLKGIYSVDLLTGGHFYLNSSDGMPSELCAPHAVIKNGKWMLFGTEKGIYQTKTENLNHTPPPHPPYIRKIELHSDSIIPPTEYDQSKPGLHLASRENHLSFEVSIPFYENRSKLKFRYRLKGFDDWKTCGADIPKIVYTNLSHGAYKLQVQAAYANDNWASPGLDLDIQITPAFYQTGWFYMIISLLLLVMIYLAVLIRTAALRRKNTELSRQVQNAVAQLQVKNNDLTRFQDQMIDSLRYARTIQEAIQPSEQILRQHVPNYFILNMPKGIVSGDTFWFYPFKDKLWLAAIDCSGHGIPGALLTMLVQEMFTDIARNHDGLSPAAFLELVDESVKKELRQAETGNKDGMDLALVEIDFKHHRLTYAGARNPLYYTINGAIAALKPTYRSVGESLGKRTPRFTNQEISIENGSQIFMATDGFQDQFGGKDRKKFMKWRLVELLNSITQLPPEQQHEKLQSKFNQWKGAREQIDDVLVCGFKIEIP